MSNGELMSNVGGGGPLDNRFSPNSDIDNDGDLRVGISLDGQFEYRGRLDDFALFDTALSGDEIRSIYTNGLNGLNVQQVQAVPEPSTIALFAVLAATGVAAKRRSRKW
jgi:hypothetical protein